MGNGIQTKDPINKRIQIPVISPAFWILFLSLTLFPRFLSAHMPSLQCHPVHIPLTAAVPGCGSAGSFPLLRRNTIARYIPDLFAESQAALLLILPAPALSLRKPGLSTLHENPGNIMISHNFINILISTGSLFQVLASTNGMYDILRFKTGNFLFE